MCDVRSNAAQIEFVTQIAKSVPLEPGPVKNRRELNFGRRPRP